jgi:hypothetical protein
VPSLDPLSGIANANYAMTLGMEHRYPEATSQFAKRWSVIRISEQVI